MKKLVFSLLAFTPFITSAQGLQNYIPTFVTFLSDVLIPFLLGIAFLIVVFNVVRYFIFEINGAGDKKQGVASGREKAKAYILYSVFAFVFIVVFWGIIELLVNTTGLDGVPMPKTDFETKFGP